MANFAVFSPKGIASLAVVGVASFLGGSYISKKNNKALIPSFDPSLAQVENRTSEIMKYGFPSLSEIRSFDDFVLSYDKRTRVANWVFEHLTPERVKYSEHVDRSKCQFQEDPSIHKLFRATNDDYKGSGFDRGHLAAAGNHRLIQRHCDQTFYLSNISPQVGEGFNRHAWNRLEKYVRNLTKTYPNVYVCTGPLFIPRREEDGKWYVKYQVIGRNQVAVPTHFFKVIVSETIKGDFHLESYIMPNERIKDDIPLTAFLVHPETVQKYSGLLFFDRISSNKLTLVNKSKSITV